MTIPAFIIGILLSTIYGVAFHLLIGGGLVRLILYILLSWIGFWIGHALAAGLGITFGSLGPLHLAMATLGSLIFLLLGYWLSLVEINKSQGK